MPPVFGAHSYPTRNCRGDGQGLDGVRVQTEWDSRDIHPRAIAGRTMEGCRGRGSSRAGMVLERTVAAGEKEGRKSGASLPNDRPRHLAAGIESHRLRYDIR
jgi:hypothetical protein